MYQWVTNEYAAQNKTGSELNNVIYGCEELYIIMQLNFAFYEIFYPFDYTNWYMIEHYNICQFFMIVPVCGAWHPSH